MNNTTHKESGLSLIEAMISLVIFALGSLGILSIYFSTFDMDYDNQYLTSAYQIAQSAMAAIRADGAHANQLNGATVSAAQSSNAVLAPVESAMSQYGMPNGASVSIGVTPINGADICPCNASVSVSWGSGTQKTYSTQSVVGY